MKKLQLTDIIETERLIIRMPQVSEAEVFYTLIDDHTHKFMVWEKGDDYTETEKHLQEIEKECEKGESWQAAIYLKDGIAIGRFGMHSVDETTKSICLGYWLATQYWGKGYISECVEWIKEYGFTEMGLDKITIICVKENTASAKVAEKAGFTLDGIIRHDEIQKEKYVDNCHYSFLKEEYTN